tara:strand:+ start:277 stop:477 length:201 start_codon:yes stop_codon:yes gene_type:complete
MKYIILITTLLMVGCKTMNYEYQVHLKDGTGTMHLYTGQDYQDAKQYIKEYEKSHGDMILVKTPIH